MSKLTLSTLGHTWIFDLDGTIVKHNGYRTDGKDTFLPGAKEFLLNIPAKDMIIFVTAREAEYREMTENFLKKNHIRYDHIIFGAPHGERILVNDNKPGNLCTSIAVAVERNHDFNIEFVEDETL